ncbi:S1C family serine protease [Gulosibacter chungangensis]|uniref:PDZ domain-containing protein n=1 Tax=Gulosibacter chungangensis TaxID=979746 RepID=A0A7J5BA56_9MICO|nr:trypsin-like peptidase domain-containing protein [Gulosibacter chungangensis]KAB1642639.1 PDZ domain-containing protein [Gulosibacter chungangensis]
MNTTSNPEPEQPTPSSGSQAQPSEPTADKNQYENASWQDSAPYPYQQAPELTWQGQSNVTRPYQTVPQYGMDPTADGGFGGAGGYEGGSGGYGSGGYGGSGYGSNPPYGDPGQFAQHPAGAAPAGQAKPASGWKRALVAMGAALALVLAGGFGGVAVGTALADGATQQSTGETPPQWNGGADSQSDSGPTYPWDESQGQGQQQFPNSGGATDSAEIDANPASDSESAGVVIIETVLGYQSAEAAGTGIMLSADGLVLTNNHVIEGSTEIAVTTADGDTYSATVVGTDSTEDVAVLQLDDASNMTTATIDDDDDLAVGDEIAAIGNTAGGGELLSAAGTVTSLDASVTTSSMSRLEATETLTDMIEIDADVVSGDSGGAVLDDEGEVVGMTTAASSGTADITGYAIHIDDALDIAADIVNGVETDTNTIGTPAFLGIALSSETSSQQGQRGQQPGGSQQLSGATIAGVYEDTPAAELGLAAGDTITAIDDVSVSSASELSGLIAEYTPGTEITVTWTTSAGESVSGTTTLMAGPAD